MLRNGKGGDHTQSISYFIASSFFFQDFFFADFARYCIVVSVNYERFSFTNPSKQVKVGKRILVNVIAISNFIFAKDYTRREDIDKDATDISSLYLEQKLFYRSVLIQFYLVI